MEVADVGHPLSEVALTENVSAKGARVLAKHERRVSETVRLASLSGTLSAQGRVVYCQCLPGNQYALGLVLQDPDGEWVVHPVNAPTEAS